MKKLNIPLIEALPAQLEQSNIERYGRLATVHTLYPHGEIPVQNLGGLYDDDDYGKGAN